MERSRYDMSYKYFLGYHPEDDVISPSLLTKFRKMRLVDEDILDKLIAATVRIAIDLGILKSNNIIVDSLHSTSRFHNHRPHEVLQEEAKKLRKLVYEIDESMKEKFPAKITGDNIEEHIAYCKQLISVIESDERFQIYGKVTTASNYLNKTPKKCGIGQTIGSNVTPNSVKRSLSFLVMLQMFHLSPIFA